MLGYIAVEPDLEIERVPDHLHGHEDILWPAGRNVTPGLRPAEPVPFFNVSDLYHRFRLTVEDVGEVGVFVWSQRDPNALPERVTEAIWRQARADARNR